MNIPLSDGRRETYCLNVVSGAMTGTDAARLAGYCPKNPKNARVMSWYLLKRPDVQDRIAQLREAASDEAIMTLVQRKIVLSQIADSRLADYYDKEGHLNPLAEGVPNPHAVASVGFAYDPIHKKPAPVRLRLHDKVNAIVELCRLDGSYKKPSASVTVAPITSVAVGKYARTRLAAILNKMSVRIAEKKYVPGKQEETSGQASQ